MPYMPMSAKQPSPKAAGTPRPNKRPASDGSEQPKNPEKGKGKAKIKARPRPNKDPISTSHKAVLQRHPMTGLSVSHSTRVHADSGGQDPGVKGAITCAINKAKHYHECSHSQE
jgi:hypothetical protein